MKLHRLQNDLPLKGKRVLVRIDGNVPIENGRAVDGPHGRIARVAVDLDWLIQRGARVIVMTHLGRPGGRRRSAFSVKPIAKRLSNLLGTKIPVSSALIGGRVESFVSGMKDGQILMLENLRFDPREETNDPQFAAQLARLGDLYINDAFSVSHRAHASVSALARLFHAYAGHLLDHETEILSSLETQTKHPFVLLMGGAKIETKLPVIEHLSKQADRILLGGTLATTFLVAEGKAVGRSVYDKQSIAIIQRMPKQLKKNIFLPEDVLIASSLRKDAKSSVVLVSQIPARSYIVDVGPKTLERYVSLIENAKTIVWNGPFGYCEVSAFCVGTKQIAQSIAKQTGSATTIVGGGDTGPVLEKLKLADQFTLLSTGGGALLDYLAGAPMPGLDVLSK